MTVAHYQIYYATGENPFCATSDSRLNDAWCRAIPLPAAELRA